MSRFLVAGFSEIIFGIELLRKGSVPRGVDDYFGNLYIFVKQLFGEIYA